jgi:hypothetical protein
MNPDRFVYDVSPGELMKGTPERHSSYLPTRHGPVCEGDRGALWQFERESFWSRGAGDGEGAVMI